MIFACLQPALPAYEQGCSRDNRILYTTLAAISLASRSCHRIATPILYHTIEVSPVRGRNHGLKTQ